MRHALLLALALLAPTAYAQIQIRAAVAPDTEGDTDGMTRQPVVTTPGHEVWVGDVVLDLPPSSIQTVGLETDGSGGSALSLWLSDEAGQAFAVLTAESLGRALAVVYDGRVLVAPVVVSPIPNGLVMITGLGDAEAERLADEIRRANEPPEPDVVRPAPLPQSPPREPEPPVRATALPAQPPVLDLPRAPASAASQAAQRFVDAVAARDWRAAAAMLHPQSLRVARAGALSTLELDGRTVRVRSEGQEGSLVASDALGFVPSGRASDLDDQNLTTLYLAALDALGVWGTPGPPRRVIGEILDGDRVHVLLRAATADAGVSDVSLVTLARDGAEWRPLLTQPQGF